MPDLLINPLKPDYILIQPAVAEHSWCNEPNVHVEQIWVSDSQPTAPAIIKRNISVSKFSDHYPPRTDFATVGLRLLLHKDPQTQESPCTQQ